MLNLINQACCTEINNKDCIYVIVSKRIKNFTKNGMHRYFKVTFSKTSSDFNCFKLLKLRFSIPIFTTSQTEHVNYQTKTSRLIFIIAKKHKQTFKMAYTNFQHYFKNTKVNSQ